MLLVVDAGNTNVVFAVHDGAAGAASGASAPSRSARPTNTRVWLLTPARPSSASSATT